MIREFRKKVFLRAWKNAVENICHIQPKIAYDKLLLKRGIRLI
jgi:hypothetical protein